LKKLNLIARTQLGVPHPIGVRTVALAASVFLLGCAAAFGAPMTPVGGMGHLSAQDRTFVKKAAEGGMGEVALGQLAAERATRPEVKAFGQRMVTDHGQANDNLKSVAASEGFTLPSGPGPVQISQQAKLERLHGAAFDNAYIATMIKDHKTDAAGFATEAAAGRDRGVRRFAAQTVPVVKSHLAMIEAIAHHKHPMM